MNMMKRIPNYCHFIAEQLDGGNVIVRRVIYINNRIIAMN